MAGMADRTRSRQPEFRILQSGSERRRCFAKTVCAKSLSAAPGCAGAMKTLQEFQTRALSEVRLPELHDPLARLFDRFDLTEARSIVELTNRLPGTPAGAIEKGAAGTAVVAATIRHYYGKYDGKGFFDFQYPYWGDRGPDARFPTRQMDIVFLMPARRSRRGSVGFQIEAKNYQNMTRPTLTARSLARQIAKDRRYLNPRLPGHAPLVPVWWFLQGLAAEARAHLEAIDFRVVDFSSDPLPAQLSRAFRVPDSLIN